MKYFSLHKIIARLAKEHNYFPLFKKYYFLPKIENNISDITYSKSDFCLEQIFSYNMDLHLLFYRKEGQEMSQQFNDILFSLLKSYIYTFLKENQIQDIFVEELNNCKFYVPNVNIEKYITHMKTRNISPWLFLQYSFTWVRSKKGYSFWDNMNANYRKYLTSVLINITI